MEIRLAQESEAEKNMVIAMWKACFDDSDDFVKWFFDSIYSPENTLVLFEDEKPAGSMQMLQKRINLNQEVITMPYIVGVCTYPEYRKKGYAKRLLKEALVRMKAQGHSLCMLLPFESQFYRKLGWETCYFHHQYQLIANDISQLLINYSYVGTEEIIPIDFDNDIDKLIAVYNRFIANKNGSIVRTEFEWLNIIKDLSLEGYEGIFIENKDMLLGYMLYRVESVNGKTDNEGSIYHIDEIAYVKHEAFLGMLKYMRDNNASFKITTSTDNNIYMYLPVQSAKLSIMPFMMVRVVDINSLKPILSDLILVKRAIVISIIDEFVEWNNCSIILNTSEDITIDLYHTAPIDISCHMNVFTQLLFGTITIEQAVNEGRISGHNHLQGRLTEYIEIKKMGTNYINDHY